MTNCIDGVMLSVVDRGFKPWSGQTKDYKIGICCFFAKHSALRKRAKNGWLGIGIMCFEWGDISIRRLVFQ